MQKQGETLSFKKKALLSKNNFEIIKQVNKTNLILESLDHNIFNSIKNCYIFNDDCLLKAICDFLSKNSDSEMIVRKVCEKYGLDLSINTS